MISQFEPDYRVPSASVSHESFSPCGKQLSSRLASGHFDDRSSFSQSASLQGLGSCLDMVPDDQLPEFGNHAEAKISGSTDWSFSDLNSPSLSFVFDSPHRDIDSRSSSQSQGLSAKLLLADDDKGLNEQVSQYGSWLYVQKNRSSDVEMPVDRERVNLLDFPDPWGRIGVILGLHEDCLRSQKEIQAPELTEEECDDQEITAIFESDLPPSDIPVDDSLDDILLAPSSLPIAESSEAATEVSPIVSFVAGAVQDVSDLILGEVDNSGLDECSESQSDEILSFSEPVLDSNMDENQSLKITGHSTNVAQNINARISNDNAFGAFEEDSRRFSADDKINSTPALFVIGHDVTISTQSHTAPVIVPQDDKRTEFSQFPVVIPWGGGVSVPQERNLLLDYPVDNAEAISQKGSVLTIPELLQCNGVYQGPCLLSDESE